MSYIPTYEEVKLFIETVRSISSYDFSHYSIKSFTRRIEKVLSDYNFKNVKDLIRKVVKDRQFLEQIVKDITVNTTEFFRDPEVWIKLRYLIAEKFLNEMKLYIWHPGCSSGQEVYSMLFLLDLIGMLDKAEVYGTDINEDVLEIARNGVYRSKDITDYKENFEKFFSIFHHKPQIEDFFDFDKKTSKYKVKDKYLNRARFLKHDLVNDGNIFGVDFHIIMCRNVLIYFDPELQNKTYEFFYNNLRDNGLLVLGRHESIISGISAKFEKQGTIYIKKPYYYHNLW